MKVIAYCALIVLAGVLLAISIMVPDKLNSNDFLMHFINHEILAVQAVMVTVSLVSIAQNHLELSRIERKLGAKIFDDARREISGTARILIGSLLIMLLLLIFSGGVNSSISPSIAAVLKSANLLLLVGSILAMADIVNVSRVIAAAEAGEANGDEEGGDSGSSSA